MRKKIFIIVMLVALAAIITGCTYNENLLNNYNFDYDDTTALKEDWTLKSGGTSESSVFTISDKTLTINTSTAGWAYAAQDVKLRNNSYYKVTYIYNITSISIYDSSKGSNLNGLYIGFLEAPAFNIGEDPDGLVTPYLHNGRQSTNTEVSFYFKTSNITRSTLAIFVGSEDVPVNANVNISELRVERVQKSAVATGTNPDTGKEERIFFSLKSTVFGANTDKNIVFLVLGAVFTAVLGYLAYILIRRNMHKESSYTNGFLMSLRDSKVLGIAMVAGFAFLIRILILGISTIVAGTAETLYLGFGVESQATQALFIGNHGPIYLKTTLEEFATKFSYSYAEAAPEPLSLYLLGLVGLMSKSAANPVLIASFLIKLLATFADVGAIILIYTMIEKKAGKVSAFIMSVLYAALPIVFSMSGAWGMSESITAFLVVLTFYFILKNNYWGVAGAYFAAFAFSTSALLILPIVLFYAINQIITRPKMRLPIILSFVGAFALYYAITVPFNYLEIQKGSAFACVTNYFNAVIKGNNFYSANAFNFQALLKNNFATVTTESTFITIIFDVFVFALVGAGYFKNKNRMELPLLAAFMVAMLFTFTNKMTPVSMFMVLPLMFIYAGMAKEKRVFFIGIAYATFMFINASYLYMIYDYTATGWAQLGYDNAMMYVFGAFSLVLALYFVYVVYDIVASRKVAKIKPMEVPYLVWVKSFGYRIKTFFQSFSKSMK